MHSIHPYNYIYNTGGTISMRLDGSGFKATNSHREPFPYNKHDGDNIYHVAHASGEETKSDAPTTSTKLNR
jgi:tartrate dehydratase beta subunit/fumarate hydratase class I family protein